jgi:hypothetical protein
MTSHVPAQSAPDESRAPSGTPQRPRGAVWVVTALYLFSGAVFASWLKGSGESNSRTADPPPQHQHSIHPTNG